MPVGELSQWIFRNQLYTGWRKVLKSLGNLIKLFGTPLTRHLYLPPPYLAPVTFCKPTCCIHSTRHVRDQNVYLFIPQKYVPDTAMGWVFKKEIRPNWGRQLCHTTLACAHARACICGLNIATCLLSPYRLALISHLHQRRGSKSLNPMLGTCQSSSQTFKCSNNCD